MPSTITNFLLSVFFTIALIFVYVPYCPLLISFILSPSSYTLTIRPLVVIAHGRLTTQRILVIGRLEVAWRHLVIQPRFQQGEQVAIYDVDTRHSLAVHIDRFRSGSHSYDVIMEDHCRVLVLASLVYPAPPENWYQHNEELSQWWS